MKKVVKQPITTQSDKYKKGEGREAFQKDQETEFLDGTGLKEDLVTSKEGKADNHGVVIDSEHPENQEWHAREAQNRENHP
jgi:hypothetical protein